jgi:hypothetical protein
MQLAVAPSVWSCHNYKTPFRPITDHYATLCLSVGEEYEDDVTKSLLEHNDVTKSLADNSDVSRKGPFDFRELKRATTDNGVNKDNSPSGVPFPVSSGMVLHNK